MNATDPSRLSVRTRLVLVAVLVVVVVATSVFVAGDGSPQGRLDTGARRWVSSAECKDCHARVWDEWVGSQHQIAYLNPEVRKLSDDFRNKACQACHLPRPVAETGYLERTLHRTTLPDEGVSCLTCHLGADGRILARNDAPSAPCSPRADAAFHSVSMCESCHNQHGTTDQWRATKFAAEGVGCNDCHMPRQPDGGFDHSFPGGHSRKTLLAAIAMSAGVEGETLVIEVENRGAGHNFPTEERSRAADVLVAFGPGQDGGTGDWQRAHRFRLPYRSEPLPDTTLPFGAIERIEVPIPADARSARLRSWYRRTPFVGDDDPRSTLLHEGSFTLRETTGGPLAAIPLHAVPPAPGVVEAPEPQLGNPGKTVVSRSGDGAAWSGPRLPPITLLARGARFAAVRDSVERPAESRLAELDELVTTAFGAEAAGTRLAHQARRALEESDDARWAYERALGHAELSVRAQAAWQLGRLGDRAAWLPLLLCLKDESTAGNSSVLVWVVRALADLGNDSALPELARTFDDARVAEEAGRQAIEILRARGVDPSEAPTWESLRAQLEQVHGKWVANGFVGDAPPVASELERARIAGLLADLEEFQLRPVDEARYLLSRAGVLAVPLLVEAVTASEPYIRVHALEIVRNLGRPARATGAAVLPLLGDDFAHGYAIEALGRIGFDAAVPHLLARLSHPDLELRAKAAEALGEIGDERALPGLRALFGDAAQALDVRVRAAYALALAARDAAARAWLVEQRDAGAYHAATIDELLSRIPPDPR